MFIAVMLIFLFFVAVLPIVFAVSLFACPDVVKSVLGLRGGAEEAPGAEAADPEAATRTDEEAADPPPVKPDESDGAVPMTENPMAMSSSVDEIAALYICVYSCIMLRCTLCIVS